jgi:lipopolysaccharide heptosyltransferase I
VSDRALRFLIVRLGSLGDVIHAIPAVAALRARHPEADIDWIVDPQYVDLVRMVLGIDVIPFDPRQGLGQWLHTARALRRTHYDAVIDLQGLLKSAVLARIAGSGRVIGFTRGHLREPLASLFYTETHDPGSHPHVVHQGLGLMRALGVTETAISFPLFLRASRPAQGALPRVSPGGYVLINPGAAWPNKRWPADRFGALAAAIRERHGLRSIVLWGPGEEELASAVVAASRGAAESAPPTSITDIAALARNASLMVSGDTGPLHIGAAVGTPLVALFGPTRSERNGPWSPADVSISRFDQCGCHYERRCRRSRPCIDDISVDEVVAAVERVVGTGMLSFR